MASRLSQLRAPLLLGGLFLLLIGITLISTYLGSDAGSQSESLSNRSVYNAGPSGYKAWHMALQQSGRTPLLWRKPFNELPVSGTHVMLIVEPYAVSGQSVIFSKPQIEQLLGWVHRGNTLILLDDFQRYRELGSRVLLEALRIQSVSTVRRQPSSAEKALLPPSQTLALDADTSDPRRAFLDRPIISPVAATLTWKRSPFSIQPLLKNKDGQTVLLETHYGAGRLILGSIPDLAANRHLHNTSIDNYQYLSNLIAEAPGPLMINEYVHGYPEAGDLLSYYRLNTPLEPLLLQLSLIFLGVLWLGTRPPRMRHPLPEAASSQPQDFLSAMADIYEHSQAGSMVLAPQLAQLEGMLRRQYRVEFSQRDRLDDLLKAHPEAYSGTGPEDSGQLLEALETARQVVAQDRKLPPADMLRLSRQLTLIQERLTYGCPPGAHPRRLATGSGQRPAHSNHRPGDPGTA